MLRSVVKVLVLTGMVLAGSLLVVHYRTSRSIEAELEREQERTAELRTIVARLTSERRVADVMVTDQQGTGDALRTSIVFVEYAPDGSTLPARHFTIEGKMVHLDAMVIKFDGRFVAEHDALRGHSVALFTRLYGDAQAPSHGFAIDTPGEVPPAYRNADGSVGAFEQELWKNFWRLADDAPYRTSMGVRVAQGEGVWRPFEPGRLYTVTLEANGGLNIRSEPLRGIYQEALKIREANR